MPARAADPVPPAKAAARAAAAEPAGTGHALRRLHGFRFSGADALGLLLTALVTPLAWRRIGDFALLMPVAVGHFFLFCNVVRMRRRLELVWAAVFVATFAGLVAFDAFSWPRVLAVQTPLTLALIVLEVRSARYRGVLARRLNPALDACLADHARRPR